MINHICENILVAQTSIDQNIRKRAEQGLIQLEEQDENFCFYLLDIIQGQQQNKQIRLLTIILLKNVIKRKWKAFKNIVGSEKRQNFYAENQKIKIKELILLILSQEEIPQFKQEALLIIYEISSSDYPFRYPQLLHYINQQLQANTIDEQLLQFMKQLFKIMPKNQSINDQYNLLWQKIASQWIQTDNQNNYSDHSLLLLDKVLTNFILAYNPKVFQNDISQIFASLMQKIAKLLQNGQQQYQKNISHLISKCSKLFEIYSQNLSQVLPDYLKLLSISINLNNKMIITYGLIAFIRFLKINQLYLIGEQFQHFIKHKPQEVQQTILQQKQIIDPILQSFFEMESQNFLQRFLNLITIQSEICIEDMIEQEEENEFEKILHPKDATVFSLALIAAELLVLRAPQICSNLLSGYIDQAIQAQFQINPNIFESLLIIIGLVPKIQSKLKFQFQIQYPAIIQYLQLSNQINHQRRLSILLNRLILILDQNQILSSLQAAGNLLSTSNDSVVQYQSLLCIKQVAANYNGNLQWSQILYTVSPYLVSLLQSLSRPTIITPLLELIAKLIEKCQNEQPDIITNAIENSGLLQLMQSKFQNADGDYLIIDSICQMLKTLIVAYPQGTKIQHIFQMAIVLIQNNINSKQACILELVLLLLREYQQTNFPIEQLLNLINQNLENLLADTSSNNSCVIILILEELYLLGILQINDFPKHIPYMEIKYTQQNLNVKNSILGLTTTMILLLLNNNRQDIGIFSGLIQLILNDFLEPQITEKLDNQFRIEIQIVSILNRFIIIAKDDYFSFVKQNNISFEQYLQSWAQKSEILESEKSIKLNTIAFLLIIDYIQPNQFTQYFTQISKQFSKFSKKQFNKKVIMPTPTQRLSLHFASSRKETIRNTQMHNEHNLQQYFHQKIQEYIVKHNLQQEPSILQALQSIA